MLNTGYLLNRSIRSRSTMASLAAISHNLGSIFSSPTFWLLIPIIVFEAVAESKARRGSKPK